MISMGKCSRRCGGDDADALQNIFFSVKQLNLCQVLWFDDKNTSVKFGRVWSMFQLGRGTSSHKLPCFNAISKNWALQLLWWVCKVLE